MNDQFRQLSRNDSLINKHQDLLTTIFFKRKQFYKYQHSDYMKRQIYFNLMILKLMGY